MRQYITPDRIANRIMMLLRSFRGAFLVVEGDGDAKVFRNLINPVSCRIEIANGKSNTIAVIQELNTRKAQGVLGVVDSDYWLFEGQKINIPNLISSDQPNLEIMLILSPALEKTIAELLPGDKLEHIQDISTIIREVLTTIGKQIGCLRIISLRQKLSLNFKELTFGRFVNNKTFEVDTVVLVKTVTAVHQGLRVTNDEIVEEINKLKAVSGQAWHYCQGHDLAKILELILPEVILRVAGDGASEFVARKLRAKDLEHDLRLAYERVFFTETGLFLSIRQWEGANPSYKILL